jgi:hypothetical protein
MQQSFYEKTDNDYDGNRSKSKVSELRDIYNKSKNENDIQSDIASTRSSISKECHSCNICNDTSGTFIILTCNHIFHIKCLTETSLQDIYTYPIIDSEYLQSRKCPMCDETIQTEDMMYLHSKFLSSTKKLLSNHENSLQNLENQLRQIKIEIRSCYDYKHKLEQQREKSKQIISVLSTIM